MTEPVEADPAFRWRAENRGYGAQWLDELGGQPELTGRAPAGLVLTNPDGDAPMWIPIADLAAVGDLLVRMHVRAGRVARGKR